MTLIYSPSFENLFSCGGKVFGKRLTKEPHAQGYVPLVHFQIFFQTRRGARKRTEPHLGVPSEKNSPRGGTFKISNGVEHRSLAAGRQTHFRTAQL